MREKVEERKFLLTQRALNKDTFTEVLLSEGSSNNWFFLLSARSYVPIAFKFVSKKKEQDNTNRFVIILIVFKFLSWIVALLENNAL